MRKFLISLFITLLTFPLLANNQKKIQAEDMAVFFAHAKEKVATVEQEIAKTTDKNKLKTLKNELKFLNVINVIACQDIETLAKMTPKQLVFEDGQIFVLGNKFKDDAGGRITCRLIGAENALGFVLFHSAMNKTKEDDQKTLEMLKVLLEKKLSLKVKVGEVYFVKDKPSDKHSKDYSAIYTLAGTALCFSFPQALEILLKHGALLYNPDNISKVITTMKKNKHPYVKECEKILKKYKSQIIEKPELELFYFV